MFAARAKYIPAALLLLIGSSITPILAKEPAPSLELLVLGSGGPGAAGRAASSYLVFIDGTARILVDAGPGSFARLGEAKTSLSNTDLVLLTHLHIDHVGEVPGLFKARVVATSGPIVFNVWGPGGAPEHGADAYFPSTRDFMQMLFGLKRRICILEGFLRAHDHPRA